MKEISGETQKELIGKIRFHRLRTAELISPFDYDTKAFLLTMARLDGDGAICVYDAEDVGDEIKKLYGG